MRNSDHYAAKFGAIKKLKAAGVDVPATVKLPDLVAVIEQATGNQCHSDMGDYVAIYVNPQSGVHPYRRKWKALEPRHFPHLRQSEIDRDQPPFMTPHGMVGNGDEHSKIWTR